MVHAMSDHTRARLERAISAHVADETGGDRVDNWALLCDSTEPTGARATWVSTSDMPLPSVRRLIAEADSLVVSPGARG